MIMRESKQKSKPKAKRERIESKINKAKVIKEILRNPLQSQREIAKNAWVSKWTVTNKLGEIGLTKDDRILWICDTDIQNVCLWQKILQDRLKKQADTLKVWEIVDIIQEWTRRYTLFKWDVTDKNGWLKNPLTPEEQKKLLDRFKLDE